MTKIVGFAVLAALVGGSVVAWSRTTATGPREAQRVNQARAFAPDEMHRLLTGKLPEQKVHDMSFVFSEER
jgi:hypothetical protein